MSKDKRFVKRKPMKLLRVLLVVFGFGCLIHISHRECARFADKSKKAQASTITDTASGSDAAALEDFHATAYCVTGITKSGVAVSPGHVAADPKVIPLGSMIYVDSPSMGGFYQVLDTGALVKGKIIDIFIPSYERCMDFGRRMVKVKVLRYGFYDDPSEKPPQN
jgi:3D (Asp-Asp-Asp) domain-containing protein